MNTTKVSDPVPPEFTVERSDHVLFVTDEFRLFYPSYRNPADIQEKLPAEREISSFAYEFLEDRYEHISIQPTRLLRRKDSVVAHSASATGVRTPAPNIGLGEPKDQSSEWCCGQPLRGSCPRCDELLGMSYLTSGDPVTFIHEMLHTWGMFFGKALCNGDNENCILAGSPMQGLGPHWNPDTDLVGPMCGCIEVLTENPNGSGTFCPSPTPFLNEYELYVMGVLDPSELPPVRIFQETVPTSAPIPELCDASTAGTFQGVEEVSPSTLINSHGGARPPGQSDFDAAIVAITPDVAFTAAEKAHFELFARYVESTPPAGGIMINGSLKVPFEEATGFEATLDTSLALRR